jgi:hypothetical protein
LKWFALLIAAVTWNLGTWYLGLPAAVVSTPNRPKFRDLLQQAVSGLRGLGIISNSEPVQAH